MITKSSRRLARLAKGIRPTSMMVIFFRINYKILILEVCSMRRSEIICYQAVNMLVPAIGVNSDTVEWILNVEFATQK